MLKYQKLTFEFFDCSMDEVAAFIRTVLNEED